jgi:hypothetical protein
VPMWALRIPFLALLSRFGHVLRTSVSHALLSSASFKSFQWCAVLPSCVSVIGVTPNGLT